MNLSKTLCIKRFYSYNIPKLHHPSEYTKTRATSLLLRNYLIFKICSYQNISKNSLTIYKNICKLFGKPLTNFGIKHSIFPQFVGGENEYEVQKLTISLKKNNIEAIFDYAVESTDQIPNHKEVVKKFIHSIKTASNSNKGIIALKITALINPKLLIKISNYLIKSKIIKNNGKLNLEYDTVKKECKNKFGLIIDEEEYETIKKIQKKNDFFNWEKYLNLKKGDLKEYKNMLMALREICDEARNRKIKILIDAEQTYYQKAIDYIVIFTQLEYNKDTLIVYGTYQAYLKDTFERLQSDYLLSKLNNFKFGCKLVCGAYMVSEINRANQYNYLNPINPTKKATIDNYKKCLDFLMKKIISNQVKLMVASHSNEIVRYTLDSMNILGIHKDNDGIKFAQLYGMSDNLSYNLASHGYNVYKYVPYGNVDEVIPYLTRRMEENSSTNILMSNECKVVKEELCRRIRNKY